MLSLCQPHWHPACTIPPIELACFLQVLNLMLFKLTKRPYNEALLRFLFIDEHLVDIGDDLVDYEVQYKRRIFAACNAVNRYVQYLQDDVLANSFNIYRGDNEQL